jgi:hypothetical protein
MYFQVGLGLGGPIPTEKNNGISAKASQMPMKDITSSNEGGFAVNRRIFLRTYMRNPVPTVVPENPVIQRFAPGMGANQAVITGPKSVGQKKWIGGNRDSSQIVQNRRVNATGSLISKEGPFSYKNVANTNDAIDALARVRGGGAANVPKARAMRSVGQIPAKPFA